MGDLFFVFRMILFTLVFVVLMQVKIGETTIEQKVIHLTHESQLAGQLQEVAQGAAHLIGVYYNKASKHISSSNFLDQHKSTQIPGKRLKAKINEMREDLRDQWKGQENTDSEEKVEYY